jgi:tRNA_anti-like
MAMMPCKECNHQISDRAASCPNCGAPVATPVVVRSQPRFKRTLAATLLLAGVGGGVWVLLPNSARERVTGMTLGITHTGTPATRHEDPAPTPVAAKPADVPPLYSTTAEQLYQDYNANVVATQIRIGNRRIRISGNVTDIDEDDAGHPLVKLWSGNPPAGSAEFRLNNDQKAAAAELVKGQSVDVECVRMQHAAAGAEGTGCALVPVDMGAEQSYLAVAVAEDKGQAPIYIVGPMPRSICLTRSDTAKYQLRVN